MFDTFSVELASIFFIGVLSIFIYYFIVNIRSIKSIPNDHNRISAILNNVDPIKTRSGSKLYSVNFRAADMNDELYDLELVRLMKYFHAIIEKVRLAKTSIIALDYIAHGPRMESKMRLAPALAECYKFYFQEIEKVIQNKKIKYIRILQLPLGSKSLYPNVGSAWDVATKISDLYTSTVVHIADSIGRENFQLYIFNRAIRSYSEIIIDNDTWITELDLYDRDSLSLPDRLFINSADEGDDMKEGILSERETIESLLLRRTAIRSKYVLTVLPLVMRIKDEKNLFETNQDSHNLKISLDKLKNRTPNTT